MKITQADINTFRKGDNSPLSDIYECFALELNFLCNRYLRDIDASQDAVMDVFHKLIDMSVEDRIKKLPENPEGFKLWLFSVTKNYCLDILKHIQVVKNFEISHQQELKMLPEVERHWDKELLNHVIEKLNPSEKAAFTLHQEGYSHQEIAEQLQISYNTVRNQVFSAKNKIKKYIGSTLIVIIILIPYL
ncbi:MAG: sigma-70 family RNA polymerase sigma factor [Bacteroidia bacterium]|jgi:RNA polymerase sigma-70 factor (ECF subfamily)|nr:sigma-70 family RNA polymerase sigma factor [Bacteroidia bacterium]